MSILTHVVGILETPPDTDRYQALKQRLLTVFGVTEDERTHQLLFELELEDQRPLQFLRRLQCTAGRSVPESLVKSLWLQRLPPNVRDIVADNDLELLPQIASSRH